MADYKAIHGVKVQYRDSDATAIEGDVWYNASTGLLKMYSALGSWASGGAVNTARAATAGSGSITAGLITGGGPGSPKFAQTEEYDGSSWTESGDLTTARENMGLTGTQTASICIAGYSTAYLALAETYDGSTWTEVGDLNTIRAANTGC